MGDGLFPLCLSFHSYFIMEISNMAKSRANRIMNPHKPLSNKKVITPFCICFITTTFLLRSLTVNYSHRDISRQGAVACLPETRRTFSYLTTVPSAPLKKRMLICWCDLIHSPCLKIPVFKCAYCFWNILKRGGGPSQKEAGDSSKLKATLSRTDSPARGAAAF